MAFRRIALVSIAAGCQIVSGVDDLSVVGAAGSGGIAGQDAAAGSSGTGGVAGAAGQGASGGASGSAGAGSGGTAGVTGLPVNSNLLLWLRADDLPAGPVTQWPDSSGNGMRAEQLEAQRQPIAGNRTLGGHPVVDFDGVDDFLQMPPGFGNLAAGITLFVLAQADDGGTAAEVDSEVIIELANSGNDPVGFSRYINSADACFVTDETSPTGFLAIQTGSLQAGIPSLLSGTQGPDVGGGVAETSVYFSGVLQDTRADRIKAASTPRTTNLLAKTPTQNQHYRGFIAEVALYNRVLTPAELETMHKYFQGKWQCCGN